MPPKENQNNLAPIPDSHYCQLKEFNQHYKDRPKSQVSDKKKEPKIIGICLFAVVLSRGEWKACA